MGLRFRPSLAALTLLLGGVAISASADSLVASSAAGGSSASSATSASSDASSNSSKQNKPVAEGPYRIVDVAAVTERPGMLRMRLQPLAAPGRSGETGDTGVTAVSNELIIYLPQPAFERSGLGIGGTVAAHQRPYGTELAAAGTHTAFFLMVDDDWTRELAANPVTL